MFTSALVSTLFGGLACNHSGSATPSSTLNWDAKMATNMIAEAEPLYEGREDLAKARLAVTTLRQAHAADYGNYEAAWKLSRAAFNVADRTDIDS